ncbi:MAG TPA: metallophosphoesterase [Acidimicrobiales bacterium]|nr:metallophosphoesterase [Acidimicrobiales bacterium]
MIRVAAVGDIHIGADSAGSYRPRLARLAGHADLLLIAGDLTKRGTAEEAALVADELRDLPVPVLAVLGNHDYESDANELMAAQLDAAGVQVLEGASACIDVRGCTVGVAGAKGFGGGFPGCAGSEFGEPEMKAFMHHAGVSATALGSALDGIRHADVRIALMHYAPVEATLQGEHCGIYPFLGCYLLAEAIDRGGATLAIHGHAHGGSRAGSTPGGVPVRNVAQPVIRRSYRVFAVTDGGLSER